MCYIKIIYFISYISFIDSHFRHKMFQIEYSHFPQFMWQLSGFLVFQVSTLSQVFTLKQIMNLNPFNHFKPKSDLEKCIKQLQNLASRLWFLKHNFDQYMQIIPNFSGWINECTATARPTQKWFWGKKFSMKNHLKFLNFS